jgi:hypothetical protein
MSEDPVEYKPRGELRFVRLRTIPDDIIGYVSYKEGYIVVELPLRIEIETLFDEGRQILAMQEYLPQSVISIREVDFDNDEVLFATPVRQEFVEQYEYVADFFYNNETKFKEKPSKKKTKVTEDLQEKVENVVSILEALQSKKDKPVH